MAKYSDIKGFTVQTLSTDTIASQIAGGSWSSGGAMNTGRAAYGAAGTLTSALAATGQSSSGNNGTANVEQYDGSSWTETSNVNSARRAVAGSGTSYTNALIFGGLGPLPSGSPTSTLKTAITESWNGSSWTEVGDLTTAVYYAGPACQGTNTATLCFGGATPSGTANNQSWNGSSWTEVNNLNTARSYAFGMGTSTAALAAGGFTTTTVAVNELWDGTSWTETTDLNAANYQGGSSGTSTASLVFGGGGGPGQAATTEAWDGSSWTEVGDISEGNETIRGNGAGSSAAWAAGGSNPPFTTETQEWSAPSDFNQIQEGQLFFNSTANAFKETITDIPGATWSSGGSLNTGRVQLNSFGTQTAAIIAGGYTTALSDVVEQYNGSSWTEIAEINDARSNEAGTGSGTTTAGLIYGGNTPGGTGNTESWNGSAWTEVNDLNGARYSVSGIGTQTASLAFGGRNPATSPNPGDKDLVESWDGSSWTEVSELNTKRAGSGGVGQVYTAALCVGGYDTAATASSAKNEEWDGTSWTELADLNTARHNGLTRGGTSTLGLVAQGATPSPSYIAKTESWNGTSWTEQADLSTGSYGAGGQGSVSATFAAGGEGSGSTNLTRTEHWNANLANKTIGSS